MPFWRSLCAPTRVESMATRARLNCSVKNYNFPVGFINEHPYGVYIKTKNVEMPLWRSLCAPTRVESMATRARLNCSVKNYSVPVGFIIEHSYGVYTKTKNVEMPFWRSLCALTRVESMATGVRLKQ